MPSEAPVWMSGRLDERRGPAKVLFGRMYEDVSIELGAFSPGGRVFSIASAGCTSRALSRKHEVVAVDINPVQLDYARRRLSGVPAVRGTAEHVLDFSRRLSPLAGWRRSRLRDFLDLEDPGEQIKFWHRHLNTRAFQACFDALLSATALGTIYSRRLLDVLPKPPGPVLRARMERCFERHPNRSNPYAQALLLGEFPEDSVSAHPERIHLERADAAAFLESSPAGSFDGFTLSNILDGSTSEYAARLALAVEHAARPGAKVLIRSFRNPGARTGQRSRNLAALDRSMLWGIVDLRPADRLAGFRELLDGHSAEDSPIARPHGGPFAFPRPTDGESADSPAFTLRTPDSWRFYS